MTKCLWGAALILAGVLSSAAESAAPAKPNIVIILADDLGYGDCSYNNPDSKIHTPHIDRLAKEGLRFSDAHSAAATCTPSRYGLLTGINPARTGVRNTLLKKGKPIIDEQETTIAALLKRQGYSTQMVGKWHLGFDMEMSGKRPEFDFSRPLTGGPLDRGFDAFFGIHSSPGSQPYFYIDGRAPVAAPTKMSSGSSGRQGKKTSWVKGKIAPGYEHEAVAPHLCDKAVEMIHDHAAAPKGKPLFLYYAFSSPHAPWLPSQEFIGKSGVGIYGDFVVQLDHEVGRIQQALRDTGLDQDTLLIFTSDNGPSSHAAQDSEGAGHAVAGVFRGGKAFAYEGGHRVPFIATWPGSIPAGSVTESTINLTDVFATLADLLQLDGPHACPSITGDSHSFLAALLEPGKRAPRPPMVNTLDCIRIDDWKLVHPGRGRGPSETNVSKFKLFNLANDLAEEQDLAAQNPEKLKRLYRHYKGFIGERKLK